MLELFIIVSSMVLFTPFFLMTLKGFYHFKYLKLIFPNELHRYKSYIDTFTKDFYNRFFILVLPYFDPYVTDNQLEIEDHIAKTAKRVKLMCKLVYLSFGILIVYFTLLIILSKVIKI